MKVIRTADMKKPRQASPVGKARITRRGFLPARPALLGVSAAATAGYAAAIEPQEPGGDALCAQAAGLARGPQAVASR